METSSFNMEQMMKQLQEMMEQNNAKLQEKLQESNLELKEELKEKLEQSNIEQKQNNAELKENLEQNNEKLQEKLEQSNAELKEKFEESNAQLKEELKQEIKEQIVGVTKRINDTNARLDNFQQQVRQALQEQNKQVKAELKKEIAEVQRTIREELHADKCEQVTKIREMDEQLKATTIKTCDVEIRTTEVEGKLQNTKIGLEETIEQLRSELRKRPTQMMCVPTAIEDKNKITFAGNRGENSMEFLATYEKELAQLDNALNQEEQISYVANHLRHSAAQWFSIIRDKVTTYQQFREAFENRYWNVFTQRQVRDQLEYGKYAEQRNMSMEQYAIQQIERVKHLKPKFSEYEIISKLAYHFPRNIQQAVFTQGIDNVEKFLILVTQAESMSPHNNTPGRYSPPNYSHNNRNEPNNYKHYKNTPHEFNWKQDTPHARGSIDKALCPGIGDHSGCGEGKSEGKHCQEHKGNNKLDLLENDVSVSQDDWSHHSSYGFRENSNVHVISRVMNVSIERDSNGSLGITLRGGAQPDPNLSRPLTITQIKPGGAADREGTIKVGDRLLSVDGRPLSSVTLAEAQSLLRANSSPVSTLGIEYDVSVMTSVRSAQGPLLVEIDAPHCHNLGLDLVNTPDNSAVVIGHIKAGSIAERCGALMPGDQILAVNDTHVEDTKMSASEVIKLLWTGDSCVLQILPSSSSSYRGYPQPNMYSCPSPTLSGLSLQSRQFRQPPPDCIKYTDNHPATINILQNQMSTSSQMSVSGVKDVGIEATSSGVYLRESTRVTLEVDSQGSFGLSLGPDQKLGTTITNIEPRSSAERSGCLQVGDKITLLNDSPLPCLSEPKRLENLICSKNATLTVEFPVAQTVVPSSGVFTVKLANNRTCGLGITVTGSSHSGGATVISNIRPGSVAHRCGTLSPGDRILSVNNHSLSEYSQEQAVEILHSAHDIVTLVVQKMDQDFVPEGVVYTVELARNGGPLGITIAGSEDPYEPIIISALTPDGLAECTGALHVGDRLLAIDGHSLRQEPLSAAITLLQESGDKVQLRIARNNTPPNRISGREDLIGFSSPGIPSVDSAVESWDSSQSPTNIQQSPHLYKSESATVRRKQPIHASDSPHLITSCSHWQTETQQSNNSLNTVQTDTDDTCSAFRLSEGVLNELSAQLAASQKCAPPSPPNPLQVKYEHRNNTLPNHRRRSNVGIERFHESVESSLLSSPRRCRRGFHLPEEEAACLQLQNGQELTQPEVTFDTFFKRGTTKSQGNTIERTSPSMEIFQVTLYKDPVYEDFGFSVSDGLYERGVFINRIRHGGPADNSRILRPYDRILQVNETRTEDLDCCLTVPLVAAAGDRLQLTIARNSYTNQDLKENSSMLPWVEEELDDSISLHPVQSPTITKTL